MSGSEKRNLVSEGDSAKLLERVEQIHDQLDFVDNVLFKSHLYKKETREKEREGKNVYDWIHEHGERRRTVDVIEKRVREK